MTEDELRKVLETAMRKQYDKGLREGVRRAAEFNKKYAENLRDSGLKSMQVEAAVLALTEASKALFAQAEG